MFRYLILLCNYDTKKINKLILSVIINLRNNNDTINQIFKLVHHNYALHIPKIC